MDFSQIAFFIVTAAVFGIIAKAFKQPLLIGYLFAGIFLSASGLVSDTMSLSSMAEIGVALLLFLLGMEIDIQELAIFSKRALVIGLSQIGITALISFILVQVLGFSYLTSIYLAGAMSFSSTIIVVKLLSEKRDLGSLYGHLAISILVIQDLIAILLLMFLSGVRGETFSISHLLFIGLRGILLIVVMWFLSKRILPRVFEKFITTSAELMFIVGIAWALGVSSFVKEKLGFSLEIGGFLAGLSLSNLPEHLQIATRARTLRDFFLTIFFLLLGSRLLTTGSNFVTILPAAIIISFFVLIGKTVIVLIVLGLYGYKKRTSFLTSISLSQISEFSLILIAVGSGLGHLTQSEVTLSVLVGIITMTISTYFIANADWLYKRLNPYLSVFERKRTIEAAYVTEISLRDHIILVGSDRTGKALIRYFQRKNLPFLVVDYNPKVFAELTAEKVPVVFGDINDSEVLNSTHVLDSRMIISTSGNLTDNLTLLEYLRGLRNPPKTIFTSSLKSEALVLYEKGADYVVVPEVVAGDHIRQILRIYGTRGDKLTKAGKSHFNRLIFT